MTADPPLSSHKNTQFLSGRFTSADGDMSRPRGIIFPAAIASVGRSTAR